MIIYVLFNLFFLSFLSFFSFFLSSLFLFFSIFFRDLSRPHLRYPFKNNAGRAVGNTRHHFTLFHIENRIENKNETKRHVKEGVWFRFRCSSRGRYVFFSQSYLLLRLNLTLYQCLFLPKPVFNTKNKTNRPMFMGHLVSFKVFNSTLDVEESVTVKGTRHIMSLFRHRESSWEKKKPNAL